MAAAKSKPYTLILDSGAFLAAERRDIVVAEFLAAAQRSGADVVVPATVIAEVWRDNAAWEVSQLRKSANFVSVLDDERARSIGELNGKARRSQIADAHVVLTARQYAPAIVVTSDPGDIAALARQAGVSVSVGVAARRRPGQIHIEPI